MYIYIYFVLNQTRQGYMLKRNQQRWEVYLVTTDLLKRDRQKKIMARRLKRDRQGFLFKYLL